MFSEVFAPKMAKAKAFAIFLLGQWLQFLALSDTSGPYSAPHNLLQM